MVERPLSNLFAFADTIETIKRANSPLDQAQHFGR